jgi:hypothetical protein
VAAVIAALPVLRRVDRIGDAWRRMRPHLPRLAPALLFVVLFAPLLRGDPPASRDHGIHYFQVRLLVDELLPQLRTSGWIESYNNGYPFGESYPVLGYLWTGALSLLSFGLVDPRTSYALGIATMWAFSAWAIARFARAVARETFGDDRPAIAWTAGIASIVWLLDPGGSREGGWAYTMFHGVWPQLLSTSLWLYALSLQWDALCRPSPRRLALAALALGGSILAHPFGLLTAAASGGVGLGVLAATDAGRSLPAGRFRFWAIMHALGVALALGWLVEFVHASESMGRSPVPWRALGDLAAGLVRGDLFAEGWAFVGPAALVGVVVLVRRGAAQSWLLLALLAAMLVLASPAAITVLRLDLVLSAFKNLQFPRWSIAIKPLFFVAAAIGIVALARAAWDRVPLSPAARGLGPRFLAALLAAPLVATLVPELGRVTPRPIGGIDTLRGAELQAAEADLSRALVAERDQTGRLRVAFLRSGMSGAMWPLFSLADAQAHIVLDGHVASINFEHQVARPRVGLLTALGVTHVVWDGSIDDDAELEGRLDEVGTFGRVRLARFRPEGAPLPIAEIDGPGSIAIVSSDPEEVIVDLADTAADTELRFFAAPHVKWTADRDGEPLELEEFGAGLVRMRVVAPGDGRITLRYAEPPSEARARWVSIAALALALAALLGATPIPVAVRLHAPAVLRISWILGIATLALLLAFVARRQSRLLRDTWAATVEKVDERRGEVPPVFVRDLVDTGELAVERTPDRACVGLHEKNALPGCSEAEHATATGFLYREPYLYRCLELTIPPLGEARVSFHGVSAEELVVGTLVRVVHDGSGRDVRYAFAARPVELGNRPRYLRLDGESIAEGRALVLTNDRRVPERVCVAAAVFDPA